MIAGPEDEDGAWYFGLNNRRLWVLKRCREEDLVGLVRVRVRDAKSEQESKRYTLLNCALEATFLKEKGSKKPREREDTDDLVDCQDDLVDCQDESVDCQDDLVDCQDDLVDFLDESVDFQEEEREKVGNQFAALGFSDSE